ncbi:hypothetical protein A2153_05820 [Candidatus Gottesmanbacteria bacterium RBG_16_38_7b]|uniref:GIY-YIG domain-containing protein n=1 Tax=Candidatus Gottesmanbacteria bacterium RBG_16_38_7b TaxID=1798372 RepID=A0A1F5YKD3_9BACT|nr:MAG: hypothetical protein A2153_05820 [Candidatus Gottesmanbacteria bacterium RBG_16_38_7b]
MSNIRRNVMYIGITGNLVKRVYEHKEGLYGGFTSIYKVKDLLYYETYDDSNSTIIREKQLKNWPRKKKNALIAKTNPTLKDLYQTLI